MSKDHWRSVARIVRSHYATLAWVVSILGLGVVVWQIRVWQVFTGLQKDVAAALIAGTTTVVVAVASVTAGKYYERKRAIEQEIREKKIPMYDEFVQFLFRTLMQGKAGKQISEQETIQFFGRFTQKLMVWGSDEVVLAWSRYRRQFLIAEAPDTKQSVTRLEDLLMAIRRDMGHRNHRIERGDLLGLFINDVERLL